MARRRSYPGNIIRRGDSWRVTLRVAGERHTFTVHAEDRSQVEEFATDKHAALTREAKRRGQGFPDAPRMSGLIERFRNERLPLLAPRTRETYKTSLELFQAFYVTERGDPLISRIRAGHIADFLTWRRAHPMRGKGLSERTVAKDRTTLHGVFAFADELELREGNPVARTRAPKTETRDPAILTDEQYERLLHECAEDPMLWLYVLLLGETGARSISEATRLRWEDVDLEAGFLWIPSREHRTKSGKGRWVPLSPRLHAALRDHFARFRLAAYAGKRPAYLFHFTRNRRGGKAGERIRSFRSPLARAIERAKLPESFRPHDLRHRRVTTWLAEERSAVHVKEALGHADIRTTLGYAHLAREHLRSLFDKPAPSRARDGKGR